MASAWEFPTSLNIGGVDYEIRTDYRAVLDLFAAVIRDAVARKSGGMALLDEFKNESERLSFSTNLAKLLEMYETVDGLLKSLENNPNYTLLSAVLCAKL